MTAGNSAGRLPLSAAWLHDALVRPGGFWTGVRVVAETGSSHDDLLAAAGRGAAAGTVLVAEAQSAGRGRRERRWLSPPRAGLTFSVLLRPAGVPVASRGWVPLLAGVAVAAAVRAEAGLDAWLKWPNDVIVNEAKLAGILAEQAGDAIVVGAGINVSASREELPTGQATMPAGQGTVPAGQGTVPAGQGTVPAGRATSLALEGSALTDRGQLLTFVLARLEHWYLAWAAASGDAAACGLREQYEQLCGTIGREVLAQLPGGGTLAGLAREVDQAGRLVIQSASGLVSVSAADIVHLR